MISILILAIAFLIELVAIVLGYALGYKARDIIESLKALKTRQDAIEQDQADTTPDVVIAKTPKQVREHNFDDDSESAIVDALTPREMAERRKMQLAKEIDEADV